MRTNLTELCVRDLGVARQYAETLALQERLHAQRVALEVPDTLLLLEHAPVYTLGRSAKQENVLLDTAHLRQLGVTVVPTSRGGDVTWHGPGQLVGYPVFHLGMANLKVLEYIDAIEEILIATVARFGVKAGRDKRNRGVWIGNAKLAAIGIRVARQVTMHGFSLNVAPPLEAYSGIVPCGLHDAEVTSLERLLAQAPEMAEVKREIISAFCRIFNCACRNYPT